MGKVSFHVDFRLAALLSENYRSMQDVILEKELLTLFDRHR